MASEADLAEFSHPPVAEAVISTEFAPVEELTSLRLIELQRFWSDKLPELEIKDALPPWGASGPMFKVSSEPALRIWSSSPASGLLAQLQNGRLSVNWRQLDGGAPYPRFEALAAEFESKWQDLAQAVAASPPLRPLGVQFAYVNHIMLGDTDGIESYLRWSADVGPGQRVVDELRMVRSLVDDGVPDRELRVNARAGHNDQVDAALLRLTIEVRAPIGPATDNWMDVVRRCRLDARRMFEDITTRDAHKRWGRI